MSLEPSNLLTDKRAEIIVKIMNYLEEHGEVRQSYLQDIVGSRSATYRLCLKFLSVLDLIKIVEKYPPKSKYRNGFGKKVKFVILKTFIPLDITRSLESLIAYRDLDLSKYPIRNIDKYDETQMFILRKYLFRIKLNNTDVNPRTYNQIFELTNVEIACSVNSITRLYRKPSDKVYASIKKLMEQGKIEIGLNMKTNAIEIYKDPNWVFSHTRWKCGNCGLWNVGSNMNYCGGCGDERHQTD